MSGVVVTGLGTLQPAGVGLEPLEAALASGRPVASTIGPPEGATGLERAGARSTLAGRVGRPDVLRWLKPMVARRMSAPSRFGVVAARMAFEDAALDVPDTADPRVGVAMSTAFGPTWFTESLLGQIYGDGPESASPALFTECVANAPASQVGLQLRAAGPTVTVCQRESGTLVAVARAAELLRFGKADRVVAGTTEEVTPLLHAALDRFRSLARPRGDAAEVPRPFDRDRDGFLLSEGGTVLVLERAEDAERRGATVRARLRAAGAAFDASATAASWGRRPDTVARAIRASLERAAIDPSSLAAVISGASGSRRGDAYEAAVLADLSGGPPGPPPWPVATPKAVVGEYGGGFLAAAVLAAGGARLSGVEAFETPDPECAGLRPVEPVRIDSGARALVLSCASGGPAAWLVLERP